MQEPLSEIAAKMENDVSNAVHMRVGTPPNLLFVELPKAVRNAPKLLRKRLPRFFNKGLGCFATLFACHKIRPFRSKENDIHAPRAFALAALPGHHRRPSEPYPILRNAYTIYPKQGNGLTGNEPMVRTRLSIRSLALGTSSLLFCLAAVAEGDDWIYTGLRMDRLFEKLGEKAPVRKIVNTQGAGYEGISVAVLPTVALAHEHYECVRRILPIAADGPSEPIGDEAAIYGRGSTTFVRVRNIVFSFNGSSSQWATDRAKKIGGVIASCPEAAPKGRFNPAPRIISIGLPPRIAGGTTTIVVKPVVEGLGNPEDVMVWADGCGVFHGRVENGGEHEADAG